MYRSVQYGRDMEDTVKNFFEGMYGLSVTPCGLFIDEEYPYLAASPG